ncbi:MAG: Brp/Blh family beta-carotene 15,15'-dioxygenase [Rubrobacteraceae bacterium]
MEAGQKLGTSPEARRTLVRAFLLPSWILLAATTVVFAFGMEAGVWVQYAPFALSLVLFGLPHGAADHLVPGRLYAGRASLASIAGVFILYLALAAPYLLLWFVSPGAAFAFFIVLTWFHWGQGDLYFLAVLDPGADRAPIPLKALTGIVRGGLPMLMPLLAFPDVYRGVASSLVGLFRGEVSGFAWAFGPVFRGIWGGLFFLVVLVALYWRYRLSDGLRPAAWRLEALEVALLAVYFVTVPPVLALGLYFCLWHSVRHIARLMLLNQSSAESLNKGRVGAALADFARDAAPLTGAALALLAGLYFLVPGATDGVSGLLAVYLVLISALTLPHVAVVCLMDLRQGVWR